MTSPTAPTSSPPPLHGGLMVVSDAAIQELDPVWKLAPPDIINALFDVLPPLVDKWSLASASAAADWYDELREANDVKGRFRAIVQPLDNLGADALAGWGSQPITKAKIAEAEHAQANPTALQEPVNLDEPTESDLLDAARYRVEGGLQKRIVNAANLTITDSSNQDPQARGWMRQTRPGACKFCVMVASRGGVFTKSSATFACHENCYCQAVPAWGGKALPVGPYKPSDKPSTAADRARVRKWIADNLDSAQ